MSESEDEELARLKAEQPALSQQLNDALKLNADLESAIDLKMDDLIVQDLLAAAAGETKLPAFILASLRADLASLRSQGARRIRITVTADELEAIRSHTTPSAPPPTAFSDDGRVCTFDGHGVFVGAVRGYSWKP